MALMAGLGALTGAAGNTQAARTSTTSGTTSTAGGSSQAQTLLPQQQDALSALSPLIQSMISNPGAITEPIRKANVNAVNGAYAGAPQGVLNTTGTGAGASGVSGQAMLQSDLARRGAVAGADQAANLQTAQVQTSGAGLAQQLLDHSFGSTGATTMQGQNNGTNVAAGSELGGALGGGLSSLSAMMALAAMLQTPSSGAKPGGGY